MAKLSAGAISKLVSTARDLERGQGRVPPGNGGTRQYQSPGDDLRIAITTEEISPNSYGGGKFTTGAKGEEEATGDEYQFFYRAAEDAPSVPVGTKCYAMWVACDSLTGEQTGWELTPVECLDA